MKKGILCTLGILLLGAGLHASFAQSDEVEISRLGALTLSGRMRQVLNAGEEFWGVGMVQNSGTVAIDVSWTMTLDGTQISYGGWALPPGTNALFTSIDSSTAESGIHFVELTVTSGSSIVAQSSARITVRQAP